MKLLIPEQLTAEAFAPFGKVIEADPATAVEINSGFTTRYHALAKAEIGDGEAILSLFHGRPRPLEIDMLERHPLGAQAFMPLEGRPWLSVVANSPEPDALRVFACTGQQGVQYATGTWHFPLLVLDQPQAFLVVDRAGDGNNLDEIFFDETVLISL